MRVFYFTNASLAFRRSHVVTILKTSEAIGRASGEVVVVSVPYRESVSDDLIMKRHGVDSRCVKILFRNKSFFSGLKQIFKTPFDWFYHRDPFFIPYAVCAKLLGKRVALELHREPRGLIERVVWRWSTSVSDTVFVITGALKDALPHKKGGVHVVYGGNYEPETLDTFKNTTREALREQLGLPRNANIITYTGNTVSYRFDEVFEALTYFENLVFVIVGATNGDVLLEKAKADGVSDKVIIFDRIDRLESMRYLFASDILAIPFVSYGPGAFPFKIFEYMGTGVPLISFRNGCIEEVLRDGRNALLVDGESSEAWRTAIQRLLNDRELGRRIAREAKKDARPYTWDARGKNIFDVLSNHT